MNKKLVRLLFGGLVALQLIYLAVMAASYYVSDAFGDEITLKTVPVDPRDLFYGDYVDLRYEISTLPPEIWKGIHPTELKRNQKIYVKLEKCGDVYCATQASLQKLKPTNEEVILTGRFRYYMNATRELLVNYGIERYYIQESTGTSFENRSSDLYVTVVITPWGQMKITSLKEMK